MTSPIRSSGGSATAVLERRSPERSARSRPKDRSEGAEVGAAQGFGLNATTVAALNGGSMGTAPHPVMDQTRGCTGTCGTNNCISDGCVTYNCQTGHCEATKSGC